MSVLLTALTAWVLAGVVTDACYDRACGRSAQLEARHRAVSRIVPSWVIHLSVKLLWPAAAWALATGRWKER